MLERGFSVIPIAPRDKKPVPGLGANSRTQNLDVVAEWANMWPDANAGVCADDNITILESDDAARFRKILSEMGVALPVTLTGGASANRPHWFYKRTPGCGESCVTVPGLFEFRNVNQYVVGPGSIHPNGSDYRFWNDAPIVELPDAVINALRQLADEYDGEGEGANEHIQPGAYSKLKVAYMRHHDPADLLKVEGLVVDEGERHYCLMSLAGLLHDGERSAEDIKDILVDVQGAYFADAKGEQELESIANYAVSKDPTQLGEPWDLPSFSYGTWVFSSQEALDRWIADGKDGFSETWEMFANEDVPAQKVLMTLDNEALIREQTITELLAFRGIGKSMVVGGWIKLLTLGGEFCGFQSLGGKRVLLIDGELPKPLLQKRLKTLVGPNAKGLLRVRHLGTVGNYMPALAAPDAQEKFFQSVTKGWRPDVIVFDTRTAIFKHDTNDQGQLLTVNEFLIRLRSEGFAIILAHHAGKNGTQRGRTDNDDITDLILQLNQVKGWTPGDGLAFDLSFEKIRHGDKLQGFEAAFRDGQWERVEEKVAKENPLTAEVLGLHLKGKSYGAIAAQLKISKSTAHTIIKAAKVSGAFGQAEGA